MQTPTHGYDGGPKSLPERNTTPYLKVAGMRKKIM
jgi:hypothetical protein